MVELCKHANYKYHEVWDARWHDKRVLIPDYKVKEHNIIRFTKSPTLSSDDLHYLSGKTIRKYKKETNGTVNCYCIPLDELQDFIPLEHCEHEWK